MNKSIALTLVTYSLVFTSACAPSQPDLGNYHADETIRPKAQTNEAIQKASLECGPNSGDCSESIAMSIATKEAGPYVSLLTCTAFLVAPNLMATNSHCIPKDIRKDGSLCRDRMRFVFAKVLDREGETMECERIVKASDIIEDRTSASYMQKPDYAFIRLSSRTTREALEFSREGLPNQLALNVLTVEWAAAPLIKGTITSKTCTTVQNTLAVPGYIHAHAGVASVSGCEIEHGNSGAPALDSEGKVRGINYAAIKSGELTARELPTYVTPEVFASMAFIANASCIVIPGQVTASGARGRSCNVPRNEAQVTQLALDNSNEAFNDALQAWALGLASNVEFKMEKRFAVVGLTPRAEIAHPIPSCVKPEVLRTEGESSVTSFTASLWRTTPKLNEVYQVSALAESFEVLDLSVTVPIVPSLDVASVDAVVHLKSAQNTIAEETRTLTLPICE